MSEKELKFKKVAWISDRKFPDYDGGAEKVDYMIRELGKKLGLQIDHHTENPGDGYDAYILGNTHLWPPEKIVDMMNFKKFAYFRHDPLVRDYTWHLVKQAHVMIFPSPGLRPFYETRIPLTRVMYQPWASIEEEWNKYALSPMKEDHILYIGDLNRYKGIQNIMRYATDHPEMKFKIYGRNIENVVFNQPNIQYFGWLPENKIPEILGKAKTWIQLPGMIDPFPQMFIKAYLSGCEIIVNKNLGCLSYKDWDWNNPEDIKKKLKEYQDTFWQRLSDLW